MLLLLCVLATGAPTQAQDYVAYYRSVANAEAAAVSGQYREALQQYEATFAAYPYSNPLDCYVAAQLAAYSKDTETCRKLLRKGLCFGLPVTCIQGNLHLKDYLPPPASLDSCNSVYLTQINSAARAKAISIFQHDQSIVLSPDTKGLYQPGTFVLKRQYRPTWDSLFAAILQLTRQYGFPAEKIIGTQQGDDGHLRPSPHAAFTYFVLIHHRHAWPQMQTLLQSELVKGNITPQMYAALDDNSSGHADEARMQYFALRPCDSKTCKRMVRNRLAEIDAARQAIGLCTYSVMEQKHLSTAQYYKALREKKTGVATFDFQPDLHFMRK